MAVVSAVLLASGGQSSPAQGAERSPYALGGAIAVYDPANLLKGDVGQAASDSAPTPFVRNLWLGASPGSSHGGLDFGGIEINLAGGQPYEAGGTEDLSFGASIAYGGLSLDGTYESSSEDLAIGERQSLDLGASYTLGPWGIRLAWLREANQYREGVLETERVTYRASTRYALGPGIEVVGTLGFADLADYGEPLNDRSDLFFVIGPRLSF